LVEQQIASAHAALGIALSLRDNPHNAIPQANLGGLAAIHKAKEVGAKTDRERDYVDALLLMYSDYAKLRRRQRIRLFRGSIQTMTRRRSPTPLHSTLQPISMTRPKLPSRRRARLCWSRFRNGCHVIRASRTILLLDYSMPRIIGVESNLFIRPNPNRS
jgi:hypothetical protein